MFQRSARTRLEASLSHYARQALPRPARYSTPSKRVDAPALATAASSTPQEPPAFAGLKVDPLSSAIPETLSDTNDLESFLRRPQRFTMLPTPLPDDHNSPMAALNLSNSSTLDQLAAVDACLHNLYDVPRGKVIFDRLRATSLGDPALTPKVYNMVLRAYLEMAIKDDAEGRGNAWLQELSLLFSSMSNGMEKIKPAPGAYTVMLLAWHKFRIDSWSSNGRINLISPPELLGRIVAENIPVADVVSDRAIDSSEDASEVLKLLSRAAVELRLPHIVNELSRVYTLGSLGLTDNLASNPLAGVPEVMPVQKEVMNDDGDSELEVPFNIEILRQHLGQASLARNTLSDDITARQKLLELSVYEVAKERFQHDKNQLVGLEIGSRFQNAELQKWTWEWHSALRDKLKTDISAIIEEENSWTDLTKDRMGAFLRLIKPEKLSLITIAEIMRLCGSGGIADGMKTTRSLLAVGKAVELEYKAEMCKKNGLQIPATPTRAGEHGYFSRMGYRDLHARRVAAAKYLSDAEDWTAEWSQILRVKVGSFLVDNLMNLAMVTRTAVDKDTGEEVSQEQQAFFHSYEYTKGQKLGVIKLNPVVSERLAKDTPGGIHPRHLPMLVQPRPWVAFDEGGYLYNKTHAMRFKESIEQKAYLAHADKSGNLELVYAGLDVLGSTPWKVNRDVFDVVLQVWNSGKRLGKIPPAVFDGVEPAKPEDGGDPQARTNYLMKQKAFIQSKAANHSDRCSVNYKIEIARSFIGDTFYFPHNLDFRGRAYPIPPHLNHIGDDLSRGLLLFAEAKPLGERGLRWLKIHCANLAGFDKSDFDERVAFVEKHLEDIYDSAEKPLTGRLWWQQSDDPWQLLATCMELRNALESSDPLKFESCLPVHQDGTCNGLQHYAALGGDSQGAKQVNLAVTDRPSDVYTYVANMVEAQLEQDIIKNDNRWAKALKGRIARKVVKQTVMTTVYGVTYIGAREQIERQLVARGELPEEECWEAAAYLAKKVLGCIGDLFRGAKDIQTWLNIVARMVSKSIPPERLENALQSESLKRRRVLTTSLASRLGKEQMTSMIWTTPMGLPIVQPYRKTKRRQVYTSLQSVYISDPNIPSAVNTMKQASAFPPNFIHSLDATHMMLTALECRTARLTFASVHDSYWTHASSIDEMSAIIRDTFIKLHRSDVLANLEAEIRERYKGYKIPLLSLKSNATLMKHLASYEGSTITAKNLANAVANAVEKAEEAEIPAEELAVLAIETTEEAEGEAVVVSQEAKSALQKVTKRKRGRKPKSDTEKAADGASDTSAFATDTVEGIEGGAVAVSGEAESGIEEPTARKRGRKAKSTTEKTAEPDLSAFADIDSAALARKVEEQFVDLLDVIPPLPDKGDFDVDAIRGSAYFFS